MATQIRPPSPVAVLLRFVNHDLDLHVLSIADYSVVVSCILASMPNKPVVFTTHARQRVKERGTTEEDVRRAIREGQREPAQRGFFLYRLNLQFNREWDGRYYAVQQVAPIVAEKADELVVITVYTFYF